MKDGKKKTSPTSKKAYTPPEGYRLKEPYEVELPNGETVTVDDELEIDPNAENPRAPKTTMRKQIQNLVGFIEYFKDNMTPEEICGFVSFMIGAIVGNDKEKYDELIEAVKQSYEFEKSEAEIAEKRILKRLYQTYPIQVIYFLQGLWMNNRYYTESPLNSF